VNTHPIRGSAKLGDLWSVRESPRKDGLRAYSPDGDFVASVERGEVGDVWVSFAQHGISAGPADSKRWQAALGVAQELVARLVDGDAKSERAAT
jgi:hypothetical protein